MSTVRKASFYAGDAAAASDEALTARTDAIAERRGYVSQVRAPLRKKRWTPVTEPLDQLSFRAATTDINAFVELADSRAETFREAFAYLLRLARTKGSG